MLTTRTPVDVWRDYEPDMDHQLTSATTALAQVLRLLEGHQQAATDDGEALLLSTLVAEVEALAAKAGSRLEAQDEIRQVIGNTYALSRANLKRIAEQLRSGDVLEADLFAVGGEPLVKIVSAALETI